MAKMHIREWRYFADSMRTYCGSEVREGMRTVSPGDAVLVPDQNLCYECRNCNILYAEAKIGSEVAQEAHETFLRRDLEGPEISDHVPYL